VSGACSIAGTTVTMTSGTGTCTLTANWATDANYLAAGPLTLTTSAVKAPSVTTIVSNLPNPSIVGQIVTVTFSVTGTTPPTGTVTLNASTGQSCTATLPAASCTLTFLASGKPTLTANYSGGANFLASSSATVTQVVSQVNLSTRALLFGNQEVGAISAIQNVTLTNVGTTPLAFPVNPVTVTGPFTFTTGCPSGASLGAGNTCTIRVRFAPTTTGVLTGTVSIATADAASPAVIALTGTGILTAATITPPAHNFGNVTRGTPSAPFAFTLTNTGTVPLTINGVSVNSRFTVSSTTCGASLACCNLHNQRDVLPEHQEHGNRHPASEGQRSDKSANSNCHRYWDLGQDRDVGPHHLARTNAARGALPRAAFQCDSQKWSN